MKKYAPEYSTQERLKLLLIQLAWGVPLYCVSHFWFFGWLREFSSNAHCYSFGSITGIHLLMYSLFVFLPLFIGSVLLATLGRQALKVLKTEQYPPPNQKVLQRTAYRYGTRAKFMGYLMLASVAFFFLLGVWGAGQAYENTQAIKPCQTLSNT